MKARLTLFFLLILLKASARELILAAEPRVEDFYEQGFYPSGHMGSGIKIFLYSTRVRFEGTNHSLFFERGELTMTCSPDGQLLHGRILDEASPYPPAALDRLDQMALDLGVELKTSRKEGVIGRPEREPGMPDWDLAGASVQFSDRDLKVGLNGKAVLGQIQIIAYLSKEYEVGQGLRRFNEWGGTYPIQLPPKWQHLPIPGPHRGYDPEVQKFTYLVSSYDDGGKLLPEFAKRLEEIEGKTSLAVSKPNSQPRERGNGTPEIENLPPAKKIWNKWIGFALFLVALASGYLRYQRRHRF